MPFPRHWPPPNWKSDDTPRDDWDAAIAQWFDYMTHEQGTLSHLESVQVRKLAPPGRSPDLGVNRDLDATHIYRDAWRLIRYLQQRGRVRTSQTEHHGSFTPHEALVELISLNNELFPKPTTPPKSGSRRKPGRKATSDRNRDQQIYDAWNSESYKTYYDLAQALGATVRAVELAIDRHRQRVRRERTRQLDK